jgi:hypothetical protein
MRARVASVLFETVLYYFVCSMVIVWYSRTIQREEVKVTITHDMSMRTKIVTECGKKKSTKYERLTFRLFDEEEDEGFMVYGIS